MTEKNTNQELLLRLGNVQLLVGWAGEGIHRRPVTKIGKILPDEVLKHNPGATNEWTMEDLAALETLCGEAVKTMLPRQSIDIAASLANVVDDPTPPTKKVTKRKSKTRATQRKR
jgi:hypothetical protein